MKKLVLLLMSAILCSPVFATIYYVTDGYFDTKTIENSDTLIMTGGGGERLYGKGNGVLDIRSTSSPIVRGASGIYNIGVSESSQLYLSGGSVGILVIGDNATAVLTGGQINAFSCAYYDDSPTHVKLICKNWDFSTTTRILSGVWGNDSTFNIKCDGGFIGCSVMDNITFTVIPEPATLFLLAVGGLLLRRKS